MVSILLPTRHFVYFILSAATSSLASSAGFIIMFGFGSLNTITLLLLVLVLLVLVLLLEFVLLVELFEVFG